MPLGTGRHGVAKDGIGSGRVSKGDKYISKEHLLFVLERS